MIFYMHFFFMLSIICYTFIREDVEQNETQFIFNAFRISRFNFQGSYIQKLIKGKDVPVNAIKTYTVQYRYSFTHS